MSSLGFKAASYQEFEKSILYACPCRPIPPLLRRAFAPATHYLSEWQDCWLELPGVERLRVGTDWVEPKAGSVFLIRFENQLGLTSIQPFAGGRPLTQPLHLEVLSPKFPTPESHLAFYRQLLDDLFSRAAKLPFTIRGPTARGVAEALRPPTPLFTYHFLCQFAPTFRAALQTIQANPHRLLRDRQDFVPLGEAREADADVLLNVLLHPRDWVPAAGFPLADRLQGHAPARVWQRLPEETTDTPENRFVLHFLHQVRAAAEALPDQPWWPSVPDDRRRLVLEATALLQQASTHPMFDEVGVLTRLPLNSQVLLRREGYRELLALWQRFHQARRPLFEPLRHAIEVRDVATLYEYWAFFALIEEIAVQLGEAPVATLHVADEADLAWGAEARFGRAGKLVYNQTRQGYSVSLRPDYIWFREGRSEVVLDAKFRLETRDLQDTEGDDDRPETVARRVDLYKMHTYRDALQVRAAIAVYPGDESVFFDRRLGRRRDVSLREILLGEVEGIGAIAMRPGDSVRTHLAGQTGNPAEIGHGQQGENDE